ncbi:hypothetical protein HUJ05_001913 [Dendroctonus ponderosae]|nr:hypothetical protein HUJ05_001913 [Dendroctonus ponderosae]
MAIPINERLAVTLGFLATGVSYASLMYTFKISKQSISTIILEVCKALTEGLKQYIKTPATAEHWLEILNEFDQQWNFPHCLGSSRQR